MLDDPKYCQRCGCPLSKKEVEGSVRPHCPSCGYVAFLDPKVAAAVLVDKDDKLVLVRRGIEPAMGRWSFPSGYVDRGEAMEDAAVREVKEETGLTVRLDGLVGLYSATGNPVVLAVYSGRAVGGDIAPGDEVQDVRLFAPGDLPPLPFPHDDRILEDWRAQRGR